MTDDLPTPCTTLAARYVRVLLTCRSCQHQRDADLQALIDAGHGDVPLRSLRWKCARCGHRDIDMVVTSKDAVRRLGDQREDAPRRLRRPGRAGGAAHGIEGASSQPVRKIVVLGG